MFDFHTDKKRYFDIQTIVTKEDVIPFIQPYLTNITDIRVLEIGCGEAGVLKAFLEMGYFGCGVELSPSRAESAQNNLKSYIENGQASIITKNIYDIDPATDWKERFDVIILKDVIEHIPEQEKFIPQLKHFLREGGIVFFAYPPWWMPFGGHQQICKSKFLSKLPWFHLLPMTMYDLILRSFGEPEINRQNLREVKETGIIIERLKNIVFSHYQILAQKHWLINPIYQYKFKLQKRLVPSFLTKIPYLRNIYTTAHYIVFGLKKV
jgi:2-polyprenyl-3-methyl-5-hydroxy-6-metoxy-1,4-benzoquinol methylase